MRKFQHGQIHQIKKPHYDEPRYKIGSSSCEYRIEEILLQFALLKALATVSSNVCVDTANMLGKASTADKIVKHHCNGLGGLVYDFESMLYDIARKYSIEFIVDDAVDVARNMAEKALHQIIKEARNEIFVSYKQEGYIHENP